MLDVKNSEIQLIDYALYLLKFNGFLYHLFKAQS